MTAIGKKYIFCTGTKYIVSTFDRFIEIKSCSVVLATAIAVQPSSQLPERALFGHPRSIARRSRPSLPARFPQPGRSIARSVASHVPGTVSQTPGREREIRRLSNLFQLDRSVVEAAAGCCKSSVARVVSPDLHGPVFHKCRCNSATGQNEIVANK